MFDHPEGREGLVDHLKTVLVSPQDAASLISFEAARPAAVLIPTYLDEKGELHFVFTQRHSNLSHHPGEISFPGGRREEGESLWDTALREAEEEIGLLPQSVEIVGGLTPTPTFGSNFVIYPYVGVIDGVGDWSLAEAEVETVLEISLTRLREGFAERPVPKPEVNLVLGSYEVGDHLIWGATARILGELLARLTEFRR